MQECFLKKFEINNFRNIQNKVLNISSSKILILGPNGSGKTSVLEAISLLAPGKGIRGAKFADQIMSTTQEWRLHFDIESYVGNIILEQSTQLTSSKRTIAFNSKHIPALDLPKFSSVFWLTPQQNTIFQESQADRRKFFDRIVYIFDNNHAENIFKYEHHQRERLKILTSEYIDNKWLDILEGKLAELAILITSSRAKTLKFIQAAIDKMETIFPKIILRTSSKLQDLYESNHDPLEGIVAMYKNARSDDASAHRNSFGAMKLDFDAIHKNKNISAKFCSTGEQQACLITFLLGQLEAYIKSANKAPILLLDELFVHLDEKNRDYLAEYINKSNVQTFVTSTEKPLCGSFSEYAQIIYM